MSQKSANDTSEKKKMAWMSKPFSVFFKWRMFLWILSVWERKGRKIHDVEWKVEIFFEKKKLKKKQGDWIGIYTL